MEEKKGRVLTRKSLRIRLKRLINSVYRFIFFKYVYFFDSNMIVCNSEKDFRLKKLFTVNKRYLITEVVDHEVNDLLKKDGYFKILKCKLGVVSFNQLRSLNPGICPVYYNFMREMSNPAVPYSPDFFAHRMNAILLKKKPLTKKDKDELNLTMDLLKKSNEEVDEAITRLGGRPMLKSSDLKFQKKKRRALKKKSSNYLNDMRITSMVFLYCLQMRRNVTFITSDEDVVNLVFGLTEALADNWCLKAQVLEMLTEKDKNDIMGNKKIELFVDPLVLAKKE